LFFVVWYEIDSNKLDFYNLGYIPYTVDKTIVLWTEVCSTDAQIPILFLLFLNWNIGTFNDLGTCNVLFYSRKEFVKR